MKKSYKLTKKDKNKHSSAPQKNRTTLSKRLRVSLLLIWSVVAVGIYGAVSRVSVIYSSWFFAFLLIAAFIAYFIVGVGVGRYARRGMSESEQCTRLVDAGKIILIFMIPVVFIIIYDFIASTYKMFM